MAALTSVANQEFCFELFKSDFLSDLYNAHSLIDSNQKIPFSFVTVK